MWLSVLN